MTENIISGIILLCSNPSNVNDKSEVLLIDGTGNWRKPITTNHYINAASVEKLGPAVVGIQLSSTSQMPKMFAFEFQYKFPKDFNTIP